MFCAGNEKGGVDACQVRRLKDVPRAVNCSPVSSDSSWWMWLVLRGTPAVLCPATPATNLSWPVWWVGVLAVDVRKGRASTPNWTSMPSGCTTTWVSSLDWRDGARFDLDFCLTLTFTVCRFQITSCLMRSLKVSVHFTKFKHFSPTWLLTDVSCDITRGDVRSSAEPRLFASGPRLSLRDKWRPGHHEQRHRVMSLLLAMAGQSPVQRTPLLQWRTRPPALGPHCQTLQRQVRPQHWDIYVSVTTVYKHDPLPTPPAEPKRTWQFLEFMTFSSYRRRLSLWTTSSTCH